MENFIVLLRLGLKGVILGFYLVLGWIDRFYVEVEIFKLIRGWVLRDEGRVGRRSNCDFFFFLFLMWFEIRICEVVRIC